MNHTEFLLRLNPEYKPEKSDLEKSREMLYTLADHFIKWFRESVFNLENQGDKKLNYTTFVYCSGKIFLSDLTKEHRKFLNDNSLFFNMNLHTHHSYIVAIQYTDNFYNISESFKDFIEVHSLNDDRENDDVFIPVPAYYFHNNLTTEEALVKYKEWFDVHVDKPLRAVYQMYKDEQLEKKRLQESFAIAKLKKEAEKLGLTLVPKDE
jgi:hypothetical protein